MTAGFVANMVKAVKSACFSLQLPNEGKVDLPVIITDKFALPNAESALVQGAIL